VEAAEIDLAIGLISRLSRVIPRTALRTPSATLRRGLHPGMARLKLRPQTRVKLSWHSLTSLDQEGVKRQVIE
jgi:hypothetical protein